MLLKLAVITVLGWISTAFRFDIRMSVDDLLSPQFDNLEEDENDHDEVEEEIKERERNIYYERCIKPNDQRESFGSDANPPQSNEHSYQINVNILVYLPGWALMVWYYLAFSLKF